MSDDEKEASEDEITEDSEIEFEEEEEDIEALPAVVVLEDSSEKESKIIAQEDWGDSTQELHLQSISNSLNQINLNLSKFRYVNKNLKTIAVNFNETNDHLSWLSFSVKLGIGLMILNVIFVFLLFLIT